ncbi:MAG: hypothetical protein BYD32DRAFT_197406 [Podila humilis]|nr:MAG: hypothetical protein BYD32DRAFT_197406 [Podila humilis]
MYKQLPLSRFVSTTQESRHLADLVQQLPLSASQFGLVLTSVLGPADENGSSGINFPTQNIDEEPEELHPHFRSGPLPQSSLSPGNREDGKPEPEYFYSLNDIWLPALAAYGELTGGNRGVKFVISEHDLLLQEDEVKARCAQLENDQGLTLGTMEERDTALMLELNGVQYDAHYGRYIIKRSACFRSKKGNMVAWAGTHGDFSIAALHVLPDYRKLGLGRLVLWHVAREHMSLARKAIEIGGTASETIPSTALYAHADCLEHNLSTMVFMERCGWRRIGMYNWVGLYANRKA